MTPQARALREAFEAGQRAGERGRDGSACPYTGGVQRLLWLRGLHRGRLASSSSSS